MTPVRVTVLTDLTALEAEWKALFKVSDATPFQSWEWQTSWWASFGSRKTPYILAAYDSEDLIGLLPLFQEQKYRLGFTTTRLAFIGSHTGGADHLGVISSPADGDRVLTAFHKHLLESGFDSIDLEYMTAGSAAVRRFASVGGRFDVTQRTVDICPQIDLSEGWPAVLSAIRRSSNFKRRRNQLKKRDGFEYRSVTDPDELLGAFETFLSLHEKRWRQHGGSELTGHPRLISFHRNVVSAMAHTGFLRFEQLWVEGECRSSGYGFDDGRTFYYYNAGYDPDWASASVGLVLIGLSIEAAASRGISTYDFLRGSESYKFDWANKHVDLVCVSLTRKSIPVMLHSAGDRIIRGAHTAAKAAVPSRVLEPLKSWRRARRRIRSLASDA
jgi:CelD/BcsL family acetyltransferase involved in cellulose biosynthesis